MTTDELIHRRRVLQLTGGLATLGLAGCIGARTDGTQTKGGPATSQPDNHDEPAADADLVEDDGHEDEAPHEEEGGREDEAPHKEDDGHGHDEVVGEPVDHAEVRMVTNETGFHFEPHVTRVNVGGSVTFVNESGAHSATAYHPDYDRPLRMPEGATPFHSGLLTEAGAEYEHTFETEGVYQYYCIPHEGLGMIAAIIVGEPDPHDQPGLEPPQASFTGRAAEKIEELNAMCNEALGHTHD